MLDTLPAALLCDIFGCWIDLKSLISLNSAYCNKVDRQVLASILSCKEFVFCCPVPFNNPNLITWLSAKEAKVSSIIFGENLFVEPISDYLRKWGSSVKSVEIRQGQTTYEMHVIAIHCKNLKVIRCENFTLDPAFKNLLWCNSNIEEIWLKNVKSSSPKLFDNVTLSKLSILSISKSLRGNIESFPQPVTTISHSLQRLQLGSEMDAHLIVNVVRLSPALTSLSLKDVQLSTVSLIEICTVRPTLLHLDVSNNQFLNSEGVLGIVKNLKKLRSISLRNCANVSNRCIRNLAYYRGSTLQVLYLDVKLPNDNLTIDRLHFFSQGCPNLRFLNIHCNKEVLCLKGGTHALLHGLPTLQTLVIEAEEVICVSSRRFLQATHSKLKIAVEKEEHTYDALSMLI